MHQKYVVWRSRDELKFRVGNKVYGIEWSMGRERELQALMARWIESLPPEARDGE